MNFNRLVMTEFLTLNPKVYSIKYYNNLENTELKIKDFERCC